MAMFVTILSWSPAHIDKGVTVALLTSSSDNRLSEFKMCKYNKVNKIV